MNANAPISLLAAGYTTREAAVFDFQSVWASRDDGEFHHTSIALLGKDPAGRLHVERNSSTAKHLSWGGALLAGPLFVLAPATGVEMLSVVGLSGAGAIIGHLRENSGSDQIARLRGVLEAGAWGLLVVVVNRRGEALTPHLEHAIASSSVEMVWGDLEEELCQDFARPLSESILLAS
jgi:hypothetical protein